MVNYRITVCYDGLDFYGWQRQPRLKTIQGELEKAIEKITELPVKVIGAGRTDAGVHARGQVANFHTICQLENETFLRALNGHLHWSIRVTDLRTVSPNFHARRLALAKTYQYRILQAASPDPFRLRYTLFWPYPLDFEAMAEAARLFRRKDDFSSFSANEDKNPIREVIRSELKREKDEIIYTIEAKGFLRYMVRTIVGALLEVGKGKISPEKIDELFQMKKRVKDIPTAPPHGLCLMRVIYPGESSP